MPFKNLKATVLSLCALSLTLTPVLQASAETALAPGETANAGAATTKSATIPAPIQRQASSAVSPVIAAAAQELAETADRLPQGLSASERSSFKQFVEPAIAAIEQRQQWTPETSSSQVAAALKAVAGLLAAPSTTVPLADSQKVALAEQLLQQIAFFPQPCTTDQNKNRVLAVMQTLLYKYPGTVCGELTDLIIKGTTNLPMPAIGNEQLASGTDAHAAAPSGTTIDLSPAILARLPVPFQQPLAPPAEKPRLQVWLSKPVAIADGNGYVDRLLLLLGLNALVTSETPPAAAVVALDPTSGLPQQFTLRPEKVENVARTWSVSVSDLQRIYERLSGSERGSYVLKNGLPFVMTTVEGKHALFSADTNYLNWRYLVNGLPLNAPSADTAKGFTGTFVYPGSAALPSQPLTVTEDMAVADGGVAERLQFKNAGATPIQFKLTMPVEHSFHDMFELRGWKRQQRGKELPALVVAPGRQERWLYKGVDGELMFTDLQISGIPAESLSDSAVTWQLSIAPGAVSEIDLWIKPGRGRRPGNEPTPAYQQIAAQAETEFQTWLSQQGSIETDQPTVNALIQQALADIFILRETSPRGDALDAGLPWYAAVFGRDDLITGMQTLPILPQLSKNVLRTLAAYQGTKDNRVTAEKPGKIMHELRAGEMARNHEIPFAPYYGSVDATPLWLMLLGRYVEQTGDVQVARELQPNIQRALSYLDAEVERGHGYLRYGGVGREALSNQGWKDSSDSIMYSDGSLIKPPVALCEVQGYLYDAWQQAAKIDRLVGRDEEAKALEAKASQLRERFSKDFWMPQQNFVALAIDGTGKQADVIASNPGQLLITDILSTAQANAVASRLMCSDMFSGFGIRTLAEGQPRYFANSYHDGSVWPHDNSLIGIGLHHYDSTAARNVTNALYSAAAFQNDARLPELFGGYDKSHFGVPIPYPVSCKPQAWAAGAIIALQLSNLGIQIDGLNKRLIIDHPACSAGTVTVRRLNVGGSKVSLRLNSDQTKGVTIEVLENPDNVQIVSP